MVLSPSAVPIHEDTDCLRQRRSRFAALKWEGQNSFGGPHITGISRTVKMEKLRKYTPNRRRARKKGGAHQTNIRQELSNK